jgi:ligand-binding SRPBCC domain-containing protein
MPRFDHAVTLPHAPARVFRFLTRPANLVRLAPPEWQMQLVDGPDVFAAGSCFTLRARRRGLTQTLTYTVESLEPQRRIVLVQSRGPFRAWRQVQELEATAEDGTQLREALAWQKPGGVLGLVATEAVIETELRELYAWRGAQLPALLAEAGVSLP